MGGDVHTTISRILDLTILSIRKCTLFVMCVYGTRNSTSVIVNAVCRTTNVMLLLIYIYIYIYCLYFVL